MSPPLVPIVRTGTRSSCAGSHVAFKRHLSVSVVFRCCQGGGSEALAAAQERLEQLQPEADAVAAVAGLQPEELLRVNDPQRPPYTVSGGVVEAGSRLDSGSSLKFHNGHKKPATASGHVRTVLSLSCAALYWTVLAAAGQGGCTAILPVRCHQPLVPAAGGRLAAPRSRLHVRRRRQATAGNITLLGSWS